MKNINRTKSLKLDLRNKTYFKKQSPDSLEEKTIDNAPNLFVKYGREKEPRLMLDYLKPETNDKILCVGVGTGREVENLRNYVDNQIYGVDISEWFLKYCEDKFGDSFNGFLCDIETEETSFSDNFFDKVVCLNVLPYFSTEGVNNFCNEISRIIIPGGKLFVHVLNSYFPFSSQIQNQLLRSRLQKDSPIYFYRPLDMYIKIFKTHGFELKKFEGGDFYCDVNWFFRHLFDYRWGNILTNIMEIGGKTRLKHYYRNVYLLLRKF